MSYNHYYLELFSSFSKCCLSFCVLITIIVIIVVAIVFTWGVWVSPERGANTGSDHGGPTRGGRFQSGHRTIDKSHLHWTDVENQFFFTVLWGARFRALRVKTRDTRFIMLGIPRNRKHSRANLWQVIGSWQATLGKFLHFVLSLASFEIGNPKVLVRFCGREKRNDSPPSNAMSCSPIPNA